MSTVHAWRLQRLLREIRHRTGKTADQVAEDLGWSLTRLTRLETTSQNPKPAVVAELLDYYGIQGDERDVLLALVAAARQPSRWAEYARLLPEGTLTFLALEQFAGTIRACATVSFPSVLATTEYATGILAANKPTESTADLLACTTEIQPRRQERLDGPDAPHVWAIIDEAVLMRTITSPAVMRHQLARLLELAERPHITIQILTLAAGWHPAKSAFTVMDYPESGELEVVAVETALGLDFVREYKDVTDYRAVLEDLIGRAAPAHQTAPIIQKVLKDRY